MYRLVIIILSATLYMSLSCKDNGIKIIYVKKLTEIDSSKIGDRMHVNRTDNFLVYHFRKTKKDSLEINKCIMPFADSLSKKYDNYIIAVYEANNGVDTMSLKKYSERHAYKMLLDGKPIFKLQWWLGRLVSL